MTHKTEVSLELPDLEELCCINCQVNTELMQHPIIKSLFHCQILTCRLIIDSVTCCIASPAAQNVTNLIHVIVSKQFFMTGKLQEHLTKLKIQFDSPEIVPPKIYEMCLKYTFTFKLAPQWNLIGKSLFAYGNILTSPSNLGAIEWNIKHKDNNVRLEMKPVKVNLFPLTLEALGIHPEVVKSFKRSPHTIYINLSTMVNTVVYVLPKLTRGKVVSVSKLLPDNCPFNNYEDLRRHWKNMYSYRLPKTDEGILYYEVAFLVDSSQVFTYPEMCVYSQMPEYSSYDNKNEIAAAFIKDLNGKVRSVCGKAIKISQPRSQMDVEYSYILERKIQHSTDLSGYNTSPYFGMSDVNYALKPTGQKVNLSSGLVIAGLEKMSEAKKNYNEKVLEIMNPKKKRKTESKDAKKPAANRKSKKSKKFDDMSEDDESPVLFERTLVDNIHDICSFYDIPSMNSEYLKSLEEKKNGSKANDVISPAELDGLYGREIHTPPKPKRSIKKKPVIKSIENVNVDFSKLKRINNIDELKEDMKMRIEQKLNPDLAKENSCLDLFRSQFLAKDSKEKTENDILFENIINKNYHTSDNSYKTNSDKISHKSHSSTSTSDENAKPNENLSYSKLSNDKEKSAIQDKDEPKDKNVESSNFYNFLTEFDKYNIEGKDNANVEAEVQKNCEDTPFSHKRIIENKKIAKKVIEEIEQINKEMQFPDEDVNIINHSPQMSPSLLKDSQERKINDCFDQMDGEKYCKSYESNQYKENYDSTNLCNLKPSNFIMGDDADYSADWKEPELAKGNEADCSVDWKEPELAKNDSIDNFFEDSPMNDQVSSNVNQKEIKTIKYSILGSPVTLNSYQQSDSKSFQTFKTIKNRQSFPNSPRFLRTPSLAGTTITNSELGNSQILINSQNLSMDYSNLGTDRSSHISKTGTGNFFNMKEKLPDQNIDLMSELTKINSDFHSILSQSSNESDTAHHESYKYTCMEALTFNNSLN